MLETRCAILIASRSRVSVVCAFSLLPFARSLYLPAILKRIDPGLSARIRALTVAARGPRVHGRRFQCPSKINGDSIGFIPLRRENSRVLGLFLDRSWTELLGVNP